MARLPRLCLAGQAHWLMQRAHPGSRVFVDDTDRALYLAALQTVAASEQVRIHAYALLGAEVQLLATPATAPGLSRLMQSLGRRYVSAHHRKYGGSGTLWDGRFRCAVVQAGATLMDVMCLLDGSSPEPVATSLAHHCGESPAPWLADPQELWRLGNTPFDRQAAWRKRIAQGLPTAREAALRAAAWGGWAVGSASFTAEVSVAAARPAAPRARGRPQKLSP